MILIDIIIILVIAALIISTKSKSSKKFKYEPDEEWPFERKNILSPPEQSLYLKLRESLPNYYIFSQVQSSQIIQVQKGYDYKAWFNSIRRMSVDLVVTDKNFITIAVIELDDKIHEKPERIEADKKKDKALHSEKIKVIRWKIGAAPTMEGIKNIFSSICEINI